MHTLTIIPDLFDQDKNVKVQTDDIINALIEHYNEFPENARIYQERICKENDVTPYNDSTIYALREMAGPFFVVEYAETGIDLIYVAYAIIAVAVIVALTVKKPPIPNAASRNYQSQSPNNALSGRTNQPRVNARIPDIFGTVRSTPDLLAVPYTVFNDHIEFEYTYMCVGRGEYEIDVDTVRDGQTVVSKIEGESVEVYAPFTSPNTGDSPQLQIGDPILKDVISVVRSKSVNGQTLKAGNEAESSKNYNNLVTFEYPNRIVPIDSSLVSFVTDYHVGDSLIVMTSTVQSGENPAGVALSGGFAFPVPRNVILYPDGRIIFESGVLASMYVPTVLPDLSISYGGFGPGQFVEIPNLILNLGGTDYNFIGKYLASHDSGDTLYLITPELIAPGWNELDVGGEATVIQFIDTSRLFVNFSCLANIETVSAGLITLETPDCYLDCGSWFWASTGLINYNGGDSSYGTDGASVTLGIGSSTGGWVGPFVLDVSTMNQIIANYVSQNGMYADDGTNQIQVDVQIQIGVTPCTTAGVATGPETFFTTTVLGSADVQSPRASTLFGDLVTPGRYMVRSRRLTPKNLTFSGTVVDEVKWRDLYASSPVGSVHFGNVTTVHAVTQATQTALAISERQLNMLVTRKLPIWIGGTSFTTETYATTWAGDIIPFVCIDTHIGNRPPEEINFQNIVDTLNSSEDYFTIFAATEFCYTFDNDNISFEETLSMIADAVFCTAHRRGRVIELSLEKSTPDSRLLFNHRNKVPNTEARTANFGQNNNNDGVEYDYVSPDDDAIVTFYIPADRTAVNPLKIQSVGVRTVEQAHLHAWRRYNKLIYQVRAVSFEALQESDMISIGDRILVADNTRPDTQDGEVIAQDGFVLTLSQPVKIISGGNYIVFLQMPSGFVESIPCTYAAKRNQITLLSPPTEELVTADNMSVRTGYQIIIASDNNKGNNKAFLLTEKTSGANKFTNTLTAINYDDRYYSKDKDFA